MKFNLSLKQSWTLIILFAVLVPVIIVVIWYGLTTYRLQLENALEIERQANETLKIQIESEVRRYKTLLRNKSDAISISLDESNTILRLKKVNKLVRAIVGREDAIHEAMILSPQSEVISIFDPNVGLVSDSVLTEEQSRLAKLHWGMEDDTDHPAFIIPSLGREYIGTPAKYEKIIAYTMAVPIGTSPVKGILLILVDVNKLWPDDLVAEEHGIGSEITQDYMIDRRGVLLTQVDDSKYKPDDLLTHLEITRTALVNKKWQKDKPYIGINNQLVYGTITSIPSLNWTLVSEVIADEIISPILISILKIICITLIGVALFVWLVLYLVNKTLQPIKKACEAIDLVAKGDYEVSLTQSGIREFDQMASGINNMTAARKTAEAELIHKEKEQRQMLDSMVNAVISIDEDGVILSFNNSAGELFGYSHDEVVGINIDQLMPEPYSSAHTGYLQHYLKTGEARVVGFTRDVEGLHKDKNTFPLRLMVAKLPDGTDGKKRFIGSCVDLTHIKQQEEQLRRAQKMDAMGKLTGGIAHDYNNMLGIVLGYASLLQRSLEGNEKLVGYANEINRAGERGAKLTKKLLNFSRKKSNEDEIVNLNDLLRDEQHMLDKILTARINLELNLTDELWPIKLDAGDLEDAILNMSINAMHSIDTHGQLIIATSNEHLSETDASSINISSGSYVCLSLSDTGHGMDEFTREKIFEPFFTTKGDQGTGLGLSQVYGFIQRSGGTIKVYSEKGHGTRFTIYIPRYYSKSNMNDEQAMADFDSEIKGGHETILLVDDEPALLALNLELLKGRGYTIIYANSAKQALEILDGEHIDLLLTDVIMPEMDGYQLAAAVKEKYPTVKIQLASGFSDNHNSELVDEMLHENLLNKPFKSQQLFERIRILLDE